MPNETPTFYAIIPANVRYCKDLEPNAKLLYGEITALCNKEGYCWASNSYFATLYDVEERTIKNWLHSLKDLGFIHVEVEVQGIQRQRKIWIHNENEKIFAKGRNFPDVGKKNSPREEKKFPLNNTMNTTAKEDHPPLPPQKCRPEGSEDLKRKMISSGFTEEEFGKAWEKYLSYESGEVKNVEKWLLAVLKSIRLEGEKTKGIENKKKNIVSQRETSEKRVVEEKLKKEKERQELIQNNKNYIDIIKESGINRDKFVYINEKSVKLKDRLEPSSGILYDCALDYDEPHFREFVENHLLS